jgi:hypothetical protein
VALKPWLFGAGRPHFAGWQRRRSTGVDNGSFGVCMAKERTNNLVLLCNELMRKGNDFPTVWNTVLKGNAIVGGIPQSRLEGKRPVLEVWLVTGERLVLIVKQRNSESNNLDLHHVAPQPGCLFRLRDPPVCFVGVRARPCD